jgi:hypothetical protein
MKQLLIICAFTLSSCSAAPLGEAEPPIPTHEKARIAQVAAEARDSKDISEGQFEQTIKWLNSSPCSGVDRSLPANIRESLAPYISKHESMGKVEVLNSFVFGGWHIIEIENHVSDEPYLFYPADPTSSGPLASWSGAATIFETTDVEKWAMENAHGIPRKLASCFAWHVTLNRV